jgi:hypothetical protein
LDGYNFLEQDKNVSLIFSKEPFMKQARCSGRTILKLSSLMFLLAATVPVATRASDDVSPSLGIGSKAILFSFSGLSFLGAGAFNGGIGGKYFLWESMAIRGSLQFLTASKSTPGATTDGSTSATQFGLGGAVEYHFLKTRVSPYVGGGISFSTTATTDKSNTSPQVTVKNRTAGEIIGSTTYLAGTGFGINGLGGIEFFITKELSLAAEYQLGYSLLSRADEVGTTTTKNGSLSTFGITATGLLTLACYF